MTMGNPHIGDVIPSCSTGHPGHMELRTTSRNCPSRCAYGRWLVLVTRGSAPGQPDAGKCPSNLSQNPYLRWWCAGSSPKKCWGETTVLWVQNSASKKWKPLCFTSTDSLVKNLQSSTGPWGCSMLIVPGVAAHRGSNTITRNGQIMKISICLTSHGDSRWIEWWVMIPNISGWWLGHPSEK